MIAVSTEVRGEEAEHQKQLQNPYADIDISETNLNIDWTLISNCLTIT